MTWNPLTIAGLAVLVAVIPLASCGYKAPLHMPKPKPESRKTPTIVPPEPAPDQPVPSEAAPAPK